MIHHIYYWTFIKASFYTDYFYCIVQWTRADVKKIWTKYFKQTCTVVVTILTTLKTVIIQTFATSMFNNQKNKNCLRVDRIYSNLNQRYTCDILTEDWIHRHVRNMTQQFSFNVIIIRNEDINSTLRLSFVCEFRTV